MTLKLVGARGFATTRAFLLVGARGRAAESKLLGLVGARGRAVAGPPDGSPFGLVGARGYALGAPIVVDRHANPFELVALPVGTWTQVAGPLVTIGAGGVFVAPAVLDGAALRFQSPGQPAFDVSVAPHTVWRMNAGDLVPVFVSATSQPYPVVDPAVIIEPPPPDPEPDPDPPPDPPDPPPTTSTPWWPFDAPSTETLIAASEARGIIIPAHPMGGFWVTPQQPVGNTEATDYTAVNHLYNPALNASYSGLTSSGSTIAHTATPLVNGDVLFFTAKGAATNITVGTVYYVVGKSTNSFQVAATSGGAAIALGTASGLAVTKSTLRNLYGGEIRDRYNWRPVRPEPSGTWQVLDIEWEIRAAQLCGLNAFTWGTSTRDGTEWDRLRYALRAAANHNADNPTKPFHIIPWILSLTSITGSPATETPTQSGQILGDLLSGLINNPTYAGGFRRRNGRVLFMPYAPNEAPGGSGNSTTPAAGVVTVGMEFWRALDARMTANGTPADWYMCFQSNFTGLAPFYEDVASAEGHFGSRDYAVTAGQNSSYGLARQYLQTTLGLTYRNQASPPMPYIAPVSIQAFVPRGTPSQVGGNGIVWESGGTLNLINCCISAINQLNPGALNIVNLNTWNDFAEGSAFAPTKANGFHWLDLFMYYAIRIITGAYPEIVRDAIALTHRKQKTTGVTYTSVQKKFVVEAGTPNSATPPVYTGTDWIDILDATVYLTEPATVELVSGANAPVTFSLAAGRHRVTCPLANGTQIGRIKHGATTIVTHTSPITVSATQLVQDLTYYGSNSLGGVTRPVPVIPD